MMYKHSFSSMIFTPVKPLPEVLGKPRLRKDIQKQIASDPEAQFAFEQLDEESKEALLDFCMGNRSLRITYDAFFKSIMNPLKHPERLNSFLSQILKQRVTIKSLLPREGVRFALESSLVIMDLLVELEDGSLVNVEMQKVGYNFPIERTFCYGADLLVRQYDLIHARFGDNFTYRKMQPVYIIVLMEHSPAVFHEHKDTFLHHSQFQMDSGLAMNNLMHFVYIPLDIFMKMPHNKLTELDAWLYFLASDNPLHIRRIIQKYPLFAELYRDIVQFRYNPKELISMYSETLIAADRNTIRLMIDEMREALTEKDIAMKNLISEKDSVISEKDAIIENLQKLLAQQADNN